MRKISRFFPIGVALTLGAAAVLTQFALAAVKQEARITAVVNDVRLLASHAAARPASPNDSVQAGTAVRTGGESRAELTYTDQTITRLGANTVFSFDEGAKTFDLGSGVILISLPPGGAKVNMGVATAAVTGFTGLFERHVRALNKIIAVEGAIVTSFKNFPLSPIKLHAGQMIVFPSNPVKLPQVYDVDLAKLIKGPLFTKFKNQLPTWNLVLAAVENQQAFSPAVILIDPTSVDTIDQSINARLPPPAPKHTP